MVRILYERMITDNLKYIKGACVDADVSDLPKSGIVTGSEFVCADSGDKYMFYEDASTPAWNKIQAGYVEPVEQGNDVVV